MNERTQKKYRTTQRTYELNGRINDAKNEMLQQQLQQHVVGRLCAGASGNMATARDHRCCFWKLPTSRSDLPIPIICSC